MKTKAFVKDCENFEGQINVLMWTSKGWSYYICISGFAEIRRMAYHNGFDGVEILRRNPTADELQNWRPTDD